MYITKIYKMVLCSVLLVLLLLPNMTHTEASSMSAEYDKQGDNYSNHGKYKEAIDSYTKAMQLDPRDAYAYNNRGRVYWVKSNNGLYIAEYNKAMADYSQAIALNSRYANAYYNRGLLYKSQAKYDLAIADFTRAIALNPNDLDYYLKRADSYRGCNRKDLTMDDYNHVLRVDPNNETAYWDKYDLLKYGSTYFYNDSNIRDTSFNPFR